jgi:hypothetical protein
LDYNTELTNPQSDTVVHRLLADALRLAGAGIAIGPAHWPLDNGSCSCGNPTCGGSTGKHPIHTGWQQVATTDPTRICQLWRTYPYANIYAPTGPAAGFDVLDVDHHDLDEWQRLTGFRLPPTWCWRTGSGGHQLAFQAAPGLGNRVKRIPYADTRARGGLCILPPSRNRNGPYEWGAAPWDTDLAAWPADLIAALQTPQRPTPAPTPHPEGIQARIPASLVRWAAGGAPVGERNARCFWLSCRLRAYGVNDAEALDLLARFALACSPPMPAAEAQRTWHSSARHQGYQPYRRLPEPRRPAARRLPQPVRPPARRLEEVR